MIGLISDLIWNIAELFGKQVNQGIITKKEWQKYLDIQIKKNDELGRDWNNLNNHGPNFNLDMQEAYVPVMLEEHDNTLLSISAALERHDRLVIIGGAGAGKSTLGNFLILIMAKATKNKKEFNQLPLGYFGIPALFPFQIALKKCNEGKSIEDLIFTIDVETAQIKKRIADGNNLFLFDGLDEVTRDNQLRILNEIVDLTHKWCTKSEQQAKNYFIVTTRPATYNRRALGQADYSHYHLSDFTSEQQSSLIRRYYTLWPKSESLELDRDKHASNLIAQLKENEALSRLSPNPFLLGLMARSHYQGYSLSSHRHELYHLCLTELIIRRQDEIKLTASETEIEGIVNERLKILGELALEMHQSEQIFRTETVLMILEKAVQKHQFESDIHQLLDQIEDDWGLLVKDNDFYSFLNISLQEYLVAWIINKCPSNYADVLHKNLHNPYWQHIISLYSSMADDKNIAWLDQKLEATVGDIENANSDQIQKLGILISSRADSNHTNLYKKLIIRLQDESVSPNPNSRIVETFCLFKKEGIPFLMSILEKGDIYSFKLLSCFAEIRNPQAQRNLREMLAKKLSVQTSDNSQVSSAIEIRLILAKALEQVGDNRVGEFISISDQLKIAKYPLTNLEYAQFIKETGHHSPTHWENSLTFPEFSGNHPVTHVSYDDALSYCSWVSHKRDQHYRLPTKDEWLLASGNDSHKKLYTWHHNIIYSDIFNWRNTREGTTPVGIYVESNSERGVCDLLGNVWEWTSSRNRKNEDKHILKGLAWDTKLADQGLQDEWEQETCTKSANIGFRPVEEIQA